MRASLVLLALAFALAAAMPAVGSSSSSSSGMSSADKSCLSNSTMPASCGAGACPTGAGPTTPCAPVCPTSTPTCTNCTAATPVMRDMVGNVMLTEDQVNMLYRKGNDWLDVAIAANVSKYSRIPISFLLERIKSGASWDNIVMRIGVPTKLAFNVACYPFGRCSLYSIARQQQRMDKIGKYQDTTCPQPCDAPMLNPVQPFRSFYY